MSTMTPEQIERNRAFIRDLRENKKKATRKMRDDDGGRCCMCVAYDTAQAMGAGLSVIGADASEPPDGLASWFGWGRSAPYLHHNGKILSAYNLNDGTCAAPELTHAEIADAFEATFPEIKI